MKSLRSCLVFDIPFSKSKFLMQGISVIYSPKGCEQRGGRIICQGKWTSITGGFCQDSSKCGRGSSVAANLGCGQDAETKSLL
ncbi:hypothetical protein RIF29_24981 [Crotalaria pallida]|uniref:Uncharacterized protein n=1 Tax=Crotalaria pallida TaxID=3830 RepID=A0AAN9HZD9_CROPI